MVATDGKEVHLRDIVSRKDRGTIPCKLPDPPAEEWPFCAPYRPIALSRDGRWLAVAHEWKVLLVDGSTGQHQATLKGHRDEVQAVAFSPDGRMLASRALHSHNAPPDDFELRLWDVQTRSPRVDVILPNREMIKHDLQFDASGKKLLLGVEQVYRVSDLIAWKPAERDGDDLTPGLATASDFGEFGRAEVTSKSGRVSARFDGKANVMELTSPAGTSVTRGFAPGETYAGYLGFSPDEMTLGIGIAQGKPDPSSWFIELLENAGVLPKNQAGRDTPKLELWDVATQTHRCTLDGHFCGFGHDSTMVLTSHISPEEDRISVWDFPPRKPFGLIVGWSSLAGLLAGFPILVYRLRRRRSSVEPVASLPAEPVA
jgi:WD domain, G-beta repeat